MFFTRLRTHAKWVFVLLAAVFAIGFVAFGVGAGGTGFGDAISDFFGGGSDLPSVEAAQKKVDENPNDPEAVLALANAYQTDRQFGEAADTLERYVELKPDDVEALRQLAAVYAQRAGLLSQEAGALASQSSAFGQAVYALPGTTGFAGALGQNPVNDAVSGETSSLTQKLADQVSAVYGKQAETYERISKITPDDPQIYLQLGQAALQANRNDLAVPAYEQFLELAPDDPAAGAVEQQLELLQGNVDNVTG
jgi:tetratricopeptide (TPR) repeat protein